MRTAIQALYRVEEFGGYKIEMIHGVGVELGTQSHKVYSWGNIVITLQKSRPMKRWENGVATERSKGRIDEARSLFWAVDSKE